MSNDVSYNLVFSGDTRDAVEAVISYFEEKKRRWEGRGNKTTPQLMKEVGAADRGEVVTWGFDFGEITETGEGGWQVEATSWANENCSNVAISGEGGELYHFSLKFPDIGVSGTFSDDYGQGSVCSYERDYEEDTGENHSWGKDGDSQYDQTTVNFLLALANSWDNFPGGLDLAECKKAIDSGADVNAWIDGQPLVHYALEAMAALGEGESARTERRKVLGLLEKSGLVLQRLGDAVRVLLAGAGVPPSVQNFLVDCGLDGEPGDREEAILTLFIIGALGVVVDDNGNHESLGVRLGNDFFDVEAKEIRSCREIVLEAVKSNPLLLPKADPKFLKDREIVLEAVRADYTGEVFKKLGKAWRDDPKIVKAALSTLGSNLKYASKRFQQDPKLVKLAISRGADFNCAAPELRDDPKMARLAMKTSGDNLRYASERLRDDEAVVKEALKDNAWALRWASKRLRDNEKIVRVAVTKTGSALRYASARLKNDLEIGKAAVLGAGGTGEDILEIVGKKLKGNQELLDLVAVRLGG